MKRLFTVLLAIVIAILPMNVVFAADTHEHNGVTFVAWNDTTSLPTVAGNYYLTVDVQLDETWKTPAGEVNLCLNGRRITYNGTMNFESGICVNYDSILNTYDCSEGESGIIEGVAEGVAVGTFVGGIENYGTLTVNSGTISSKTDCYGVFNHTHGKVTVYGGTVSGGLGISNDLAGTLTVYGGIIDGNNIGIYNDGTVTVYGGDVLGCGGIGNTKYGVVNIAGGTIIGCDHVDYGSYFLGISNSGALTVTGGTISGSDNYGIQNYSTLTVTGGSFIGGKSGVYIDGGELNLTGGSFIGGESGIYVGGGKLNLSGDAKISGGKADIELLHSDDYHISSYITVTGKLENAEPYTVLVDDWYDRPTVFRDFVFTDTEPENLEFNDPAKFAPAKIFADKGYIVIKNDDGQLQLVRDKSRITPGDLNDDGKINSTDSVLLLRYLAGFTDADVNIDAADYNEDGAVNSLDSVLLLRHLAGLS